MLENGAMKAAISRRRGGRRLRGATPLVTAFLALAALAGGSAAQEQMIGGGHDSSQPIEITADMLEVHQSDNIAIFQGNVDAVQGNIVMRADKLVVYYREAEEDETNLGISRIDAEGNVFISSPQETAQGQRGVYDVVNARIDLAGDVILTWGDNIIEGDTLQMDLEAGTSSVASESQESSERVRGLFVPKDKND